jgi:phosphomannomutase
MAAKFGTSGLRGLATELIGSASRNHVAAFARHMKAKHNVSLGDAVYVAWDYRDSSPAIVSDVLSALHSEGLMPVTCGAVPTPALAYRAMGERRASIMITGSHIPADRNGIKFYRPDGEIAKLDEDAIAAGAQQSIAGGAAPDVKSVAVTPAFVERYTTIMPGSPLKGMRVGVYQHSTVARDALVEVLQSVGAEVTALGRSDTFIPVDTEAVSIETQALITGWCRDGRYDAIVSADGDGDRPLVADATGKILRGDVLGLLTARFLGAQVVVTPVTSNSGIERYLDAPTHRTRVGSPYVIAAMEQAKRDGRTGIVGFEANGGFLTLSDFNVGGQILTALPTRDCFLPILATLCTAAQAKTSLSALVKELALPHAVADRVVDFPLETSAKLMAGLHSSAALREDFFAPFGKISSVDETDGLRVTLDTKSIIHLRPSGNAPEFRCYVEAESEHDAEVLLKRVMALIEKQKL